MGYWGFHPLEGDTPQDALIELKGLLFTEAEREADDDLWDAHLAITGPFPDTSPEGLVETPAAWTERLTAKLPEVVHFFETEGKRWVANAQFVLPFTLVDYEIRVSDPSLSARIKALIGDGGAANRDYDDYEPGDSIDNPDYFAQRLTEAWDSLMAGTTPFDALLYEPKGLFDAIAEHLLDGNSGLVNKA